MRDLIFVSLEDWDEIWRRNQFLCAELSRRHPQMRILFVNPEQNLIKALLRGQFPSVFSSAIRMLEDVPGIFITHAWKIFPDRFSLGRWINESLVRWQLRKLIANLGLRDPILWLNPHDACHLAGRLGESALIYDITDDWTRAIQPEPRRQLTVRRDEELCRKADAVIVCSETLFTRRRQLTRHLHLVPNGVDASHYQMVTQPLGEKERQIYPWPKPVLGYTGTLHSERIDAALVRSLADSLETGSVVLIGPNHLSEADRALLRHPRIFLPGPVPYSEIPRCMRAFDVCIVPHLVSPFTESLNPIKLWEYLASGKPIVSTRVAGFRDFPALVYLAEDAEGFDRAVQLGLSEPSHLADLRRGEATHHSWSARVDVVEEIVAECFLPKQRFAHCAQP